jgi:hypothetical protein
MLVFATAIAVLATAAQAAEYKMVACSGNNGAPPYSTSTNTTSAQNPAGIFSFANNCTGLGGDPPGDGVYLRIYENQASGSAGNGAYGNFVFDTPAGVHFRAVGGYTRQPNAFNDGWRSRFWFAGAGGSTQLMTQGAGLPNQNGQWASSNIFGPHLWPYSTYTDFTRFVFEMTCVRAAGCDRSNFNATDLNGIVFILSDDSPASIAFSGASTPLLQGSWVRGSQPIGWSVSDVGSGIRFEKVRVDGSEIQRLDYQASGQCNTSSSQTNGEWARNYSVCPTGGPYAHGMSYDTANLTDGPHTLSICAQDFAQYQGLNGTGSESCQAQSIRTDNTAPGAPLGLHITSDNPHRYLDRFGAVFSLPDNQGSPISKVHYDVIDAGGKVVVAEKTVSGTNPTQLLDVAGPPTAGDYQLRVWLEDEVGHLGPNAVAAIPRDTTPPAAPQSVSVTAPDTARTTQGFDLHWRNLVDAGSPISAAHYEVLNGAGAVVVPTQDAVEGGIDAIHDLVTPEERGSYTLRLWLSDAEGNVGAPTTAPLAYDCVRSPVEGGLTLDAGLGPKDSGELIVKQGRGSTLTGRLRGAGGGVAEVPLCVFSTIVTESRREFLGVAMTEGDGSYRFSVGAGPSRNLDVVYRPDQRELQAEARIKTKIRPTLELVEATVHNHHYARFKGKIPGPGNDNVLIVIQVKNGDGWRVMRRYRTKNGRYDVRYRLTRTIYPTTYILRTQVRSNKDLPYLPGESRWAYLRVLP